VGGVVAALTDRLFPMTADLVADLPEAEAAELQDKLSMLNSMMNPEVHYLPFKYLLCRAPIHPLLLIDLTQNYI
jgi:hypothetical protein